MPDSVLTRSRGGEVHRAGLPRLELLSRLLGVACGTIGADAGLLALRQGPLVRIVATHGVPDLLMTRLDALKKYPYKPDELFAVPDASKRPELHVFLNRSALERTGFFIRLPLFAQAAATAGLILFGRDPRAPFTEAEIGLLGSIGSALTSTLAPGGIALLEPGFVHHLGLNRRELVQKVEKSLSPTLLFDPDLHLVAASDCPIGRNTAKQPTGGRQINTTKAVPTSHSCLPDFMRNVEFYLVRAAETGISTPDVDIILPASVTGGSSGVFSLMGSPVTPLGEKRPFLQVTLRASPVPFNELARDIAAAAAQSALVTVDFLTETLVHRRRLNSRGAMSYITLRSWRKPIRAHQITALKAIKRHDPEPLAAVAAEEIAQEVETLIGLHAFDAVVPVPCGHSVGEKCLSLALAMAVGHRLGLPVVRALTQVHQRGSSHPKANLRRAPIGTDIRAEGSVLLVDDVATSGEHIGEARRLLMETCKSVFAIAWIGGDADDEARA